jgi:hypothetical protein
MTESKRATGEAKDVKPFTTAAAVVFTLVALVQLLRIIQGWVVTVNGFVVPIWLSVLIGAITATLAAMLWREHAPERS